MQHLVVVLLFMLVLPVACVAWETVSGAMGLMPAIGKWFVYWGVGWRLIAAGMYQCAKPSFTARGIFEIDDPKAEKLVLEIGFGNLAIGTAAIASLHFPEWVGAAALAGAIFYALAGIQHVRNREWTWHEMVAMVSDLGMAAVLVGYLGWAFLLRA